IGLHTADMAVWAALHLFFPKVISVKHRPFRSLNYDGRRDVPESPQPSWSPTEAMRGGDFSSFLNRPAGRVVIYDPANGGQPFPNNIIPATRINPGAKNLLKYLPDRQFTQADPLDFTNRVNIGQPIHDNPFFLRVDHTTSSNARFFGPLAREHQNWLIPTINPNFTETYYNYPLSLASQWIHTISPAVLNELRFGFLKTDTDATHARA